MQKLGVSKDATIVCYDHQGMFSVARAAWMLRYFGASNVWILNGGLKKWQAEGRPVVTGYQEKHGEGGFEGDYSFKAENPKACILDIKEMHQVAAELHH